MAQIVYRGNLVAAKFPFLASSQGRTIIVPQYDNVYVPVIASRADEDKDRGIPQIYYCHNVMPSAEGFQSIGYSLRAGAAVPANTNFFNTFTIRKASGFKALFCHTTDGYNYIHLGTGTWIQINTVGGTGAVSAAYVNGETYIYFAGIGCYIFDEGTYTLNLQALTGLSAPDTLGVCAAAGYLIAWTSTQVAWSSTIDPTDFDPSLITGAGGGQPEGALGQIVTCTPNSAGFNVYTTGNVVSAKYSGNARYPFNFTAVNGSGGVSSAEVVSDGAISNSIQYAYTSSGLQSIALAGASVVLPELTDFLAGKKFEDFNEVTLLFEYTNLSNVMKKRLAVISDRYVVISYGVTALTHAIIYDIATKRYGKLRLAHVDCFEWEFDIPELTESPKDSIALLEPDGRVFIVNFSTDYSASSGVLVMGKFQYIRQRLLQMQEANIENVEKDATFDLYNLYALDGKNYQIEPGYLMETKPQYRQYNFNAVGINNSLLFKGRFDLKSFVLHFNVHGKN